MALTASSYLSPRKLQRSRPSSLSQEHFSPLGQSPKKNTSFIIPDIDSTASVEEKNLENWKKYVDTQRQHIEKPVSKASKPYDTAQGGLKERTKKLKSLQKSIEDTHNYNAADQKVEIASLRAQHKYMNGVDKVKEAEMKLADTIQQNDKNAEIRGVKSATALATKNQEIALTGKQAKESHFNAFIKMINDILANTWKRIKAISFKY